MTTAAEQRKGSSEGAQRGSRSAFPVVGIGGSAGAIAALLRFFGALPAHPGMAFVVVLHLPADRESEAAEVLQRATALPVTQVRDKVRLEPDHVYVIPPGLDLVTEDGHIQPATRSGARSDAAAIDLFFRTLAEVHKDHAIGIVLSGTGSDGSVGLGRVKEDGGITIVQAPEDAEFPEMPSAAIRTGAVDFVLTAEEMAGRLVDLWQAALQISLPAVDDMADDEAEPDAGAVLSEVLAQLRLHTRNDFRHYKRATVLRRIARRMQIHGLPDLRSYRDFLVAHPEEAVPLLQDMLISVTSFFRDPPAFDSLERLAIPAVLAGRRHDEDVRVWVAGCATGEESYSVGILLREHAEQLTNPPKIQVFATDISERALAVGRLGCYPTAIAADVSPARLSRFFRLDGNQYRVASELRDQVLFAKHNLLLDPPFSRLDLICCRNLLIYLDSSAQKAVLEMFSYALRPGGLLFLGNAESADVASGLFSPLEHRSRLYRVNAEAVRGARAATHFPIGGALDVALEVPKSSKEHGTQERPAALLHQRALLQVGPPSVLVDQDYEVLHLSAGAGAYIQRGSGVPSNNLLENVPAELRLELRTVLFKADQTGSSATTLLRRPRADGTQKLLEIAVHPVHRKPDEPRCWLVVFNPLLGDSLAPEAIAEPTHRAMIEKLEVQNRELKAHLEESLDRFALSSEEYRAANEELQAMNEELRSATEELETSKEELQSMNEELTTVNHELRLKVDESARTNDDLRNLMASSDIATVFVDGGLQIKRYTPGATRLFQLIPSDVGRPLLDIRSQLRYPQMEEDALAVFRELRPIERRVDCIDDRHYFARVLPYRTAQNKIEGAVLTFVDVTALQQAEDRVQRAEERLREAVELSSDFAVVIMDKAGAITNWNAGAANIFGWSAVEIIGRPIDDLFTAEDRAAGVPATERQTALEHGRADDERWHLRKDGTTFFCSGVLTAMDTGSGTGFAKIARDMTHSKRIEAEKDEALQEERRRALEAKAANELKDRFLAVMSHELKQPLNLIQVNAELLTRLPETQPLPAVLQIGHTIQRAVGSQTQIVDDLLDLSRVQTGKLRLHLDSVDFAERARVLTEAATPGARRKNVSIEFEGPTSLPCHCDRVRAEQIIWNLLANAKKFTPEGGRIAVSVGEDEGFVKLVVADTGSGISREFLPNVFDMFSQSRDNGGASGNGLGIGLALVDELARAHGGRAEATSPGLGRGSTFTVWLPLCRETSEPTEPRPASRLAGQRVLVVDDDADSVATFAMLLKLEGANVDVAATAGEALDRVRTHDYDLLISDLGMPDMDGYALIGAIRKVKPKSRLKAVAVSGFAREVDVSRALEAGFDGHVSKPASMDQLKRVLDGL